MTSFEKFSEQSASTPSRGAAAGNKPARPSMCFALLRVELSLEVSWRCDAREENGKVALPPPTPKPHEGIKLALSSAGVSRRKRVFEPYNEKYNDKDNVNDIDNDDKMIMIQ